MNNIIWLILDSCRMDTYLQADTPNIDKYVGTMEQRWSYDSWTYPAHANFLLGLTPHKNLDQCFASKTYRDEFNKWGERAGADIDYKNFIPEMSLPYALIKSGHHRTYGIASLPCINKYTAIANHFDDYEDLYRYDDIEGIIDIIKERLDYREEDENGNVDFFFVNIGNTHYPYMLKDEPRISGLHGTLKKMGSKETKAMVAEQRQCTTLEWAQINFQEYYRAQIRALEYVDRGLEELFEVCPKNTYFIICADHGELFGEDGFFGHGPIWHRLLFQVPFVEGLVRK